MTPHYPTLTIDNEFLTEWHFANNTRIVKFKNDKPVIWLFNSSGQKILEDYTHKAPNTNTKEKYDK